MLLKVSRLTARVSCHSVSMARSSGSGTFCAAACHTMTSVAALMTVSRSYMRISPDLLAAGLGGRDECAGPDVQAAVIERRGEEGARAEVVVLVRLAAGDTAEPVRPLGDGLLARLLAPELQVDVLAKL